MSYHFLLPQDPLVDFADSSFGFPKVSGAWGVWGGGNDETVVLTCILPGIYRTFVMSYHFLLPQIHLSTVQTRAAAVSTGKCRLMVGVFWVPVQG